MLPLAFVILLAPAAVLATGALLCLILALFYVLYLEPALHWVSKRGSGFLGRFIRWTIAPVTDFAERFVQQHIQLLMRSFATGIPPMVTMLDQLAVIVQRTYGTLEDQADQILEALTILRHTTLPAEIKKAVTPLANTLTKHTDRLGQLERLNQQVAVVIGNGLRQLPWGVPGTYVGNFQAWWNTYTKLWDQVYTNVTPQLNALRLQVVPELRRDLDRLVGRVDQLAGAGLDALDNRLDALETAVYARLQPELNSLSGAVDTLYGLVTGTVSPSLAGLFDRVTRLETQLETIVTTTLEPVVTRLTTVETQLETLTTTTVRTVTERVTTLETQLQQLVGTTTAGLAERVTALEQTVARIVVEIPGEITIGIATVTQRVADLEAELRDDVLPRLRAIENLLLPAALAATVVATMRQVAPNLFCRNTTSVTQRLCGLDENLIEQLLAGTLVFAVALDPRLIAQSGQVLTEGMAALWRETALR